MSSRNLLKILFFVVIVFVGDRLGGELMQRIFMKSGFRYSMLYRGELEADIAVLGNSRGLHMYHPPAMEVVTGQEVVNLAFNGLPTQAMPVIWADYLKHHNAPKLLVLEISCIGVAGAPGSIEQLSVLIDQNSNFLELIQDRNVRVGCAAKLSRLFRYNGSLMWRSLLLKNSDQSWIMDSQLNEAMLEQLVESSTTEMLRSKENIDAIRQVLETANQHGVQVKLVLAPYHPRFYERLTQPRVDAWRDWVEKEVDFPVDDHSQQMTDPRLFADHLHLNKQGAKQLAESLKSLDFFDTRKSDSTVESVNQF